MAQEFHLKLITERAGGGDPIVRERHLDKSELTIGRAADSDIVLTDLPVDPRHAKMRFAGPGRVQIDSVSGQPFIVGGRPVQGATLDAASRPTIQFADYTLALEPGPDGGVVITVTHAEPKHYPTRSVFSLQSKLFGRRRLAWILGSGVFVICLLVPLLLSGVLAPAKIHPDQQWSSGPLSKAHAFLETDCKACHAKSFVAVQDTQCKACHQSSHDPAEEAKVLAASAAKGSPFKALLVVDHADPKKLSQATPLPASFGGKVSTIVQRALGHPTDRCASCHIEHTKPPAGKAAADPHAPLADKPDLVTVQDCQSCHTSLKSRLTKTELVDTPDWGRHPAFKPLVMTQAGPNPTFQRMALTGAPQESSGLIFPHRLHLDKLGGVARQAIDLGKARGYGAALECASCHRADPTDPTRFQPIQMERDCGGCHSLAFARVGGQLKSLPHGDLDKVAQAYGMTPTAPPVGGSDRMRPGTIRPTAFSGGNVGGFRAAFSPGGVCFECHTYGNPGAADPASLQMRPVKLTQTYMPRGAFDHSTPEHGGPGPAKAGAYKCQDCHKAETSDKSADLLMPDIAKCNACHGAPKTKTAAAASGECVECHSFHAPGKATPKPGHPPLETLRWKKETAQAGVKPAA